MSLNGIAADKSHRVIVVLENVRIILSSHQRILTVHYGQKFWKAPVPCYKKHVSHHTVI